MTFKQGPTSDYSFLYLISVNYFVFSHSTQNSEMTPLVTIQYFKLNSRRLGTASIKPLSLNAHQVQVENHGQISAIGSLETNRNKS